MERITYPSARVLQALDDGDSYGFSIMDATGLPSGTVYQILRRFERSGLVRSSWEAVEEFEGERRPRRRYYQLTKEGRKALARAVERYREQEPMFGSPRRARPAQ